MRSDLNRPMSMRNFDVLSDAEKIEYITMLRREFNVPDAHIAQMLGIGQSPFANIIKRLGLNAGMRSKTKWDMLGFEAFCRICCTNQNYKVAGIRIGEKMRFLPGWKVERNHLPDMYDGEIIYINERGNYFTVEYQIGGVTLRESFKFSQFGYGRDVQPYGH